MDERGAKPDRARVRTGDLIRSHPLVRDCEAYVITNYTTRPLVM
jgi:hypothetical protein